MSVASASVGCSAARISVRNAAAIEESLRRTAETLGMVDDHLRSHTYLAGDAYTVGDIALGAGVWRWIALPIERPARPHVERWFDALSQRPAYRKIVMAPLS